MKKARQEQVSYEVTSHTFRMDDSGMQTCLQRENMLVPVQTNRSEHMFTSLILLYLAGSGDHVPTIMYHKTQTNSK